MEDNFIIQLLATLDRAKSKKQINADIKQLQNAINMLRITGTFAKGDTKKELNSYIKSLQSKLDHVKLTARVDSKNLKSEIDKALNGVSFKEIDALDVDESKIRLKVRKVIADTKAYVDKNVVSINIGMKKEKLNNDLTTYLNKNSKVKESSVLLEQADKLKELIDAIDDPKSLKEATTAFQLYKSEVSATGFAAKSTTDKIKGMLSHIAKVGSFFGIASLAVNSFRKSLQTLKEVDTYLTEISKANDSLAKSQLVQIGSDSFAVASKYGKNATNYLSAVQEMSRAGYENAAGLSELSVAAQGAGDMTQELANQYIIATDKAYKLGGSVEKLTEILDGSNYITNHNAVTMTDLADGMSIVGSTASSFGVDVNKATAALGTMIATTQQSGSEAARAFRAILLNIRQVTDEEEGIDAEGLTKYEAACKALNVSLKETKDGITSLRDPMEVLRELSIEYNKLEESDIRRTNLLSSVGGKLRSTQLDALLRQWDTYEKMLQEYASGTGSMAAEAEKTANSWEGRLNSLQNSWDSFVNSLTNKDAIMGGISFFDRLIQGAEALTDTMGEIPVLLTAINGSMAAINKDYGITQIYNKETGKFDVQGNIFGIDFTEIKAQKKHFTEAKEAISIWNDELLNGKTDLESFSSSLVQNNAQLKAYLATTSKDAPASLNGYKSYLNEAGVSTDALRLKTILLNSVISFGLGLAIQAAVQGITNLIHATEEVRQNAQELGKEFSNTKSEIEDYKEKIEELHKTINDSNSSIEDVTNARKTLMSVQDELIDKFGTEKSVINDITDAINNQADAFDRLIEKQWQETKNKFNDGGFWNDVANWFDGYDDNIDRMVDTMENTREILSFSYNDFNGKNGDYSEIKRQIEQLGWVYKDTLGGYVKEGNLENIYSDILKIQDLVNNFDAPDMLVKDLTKDANKIKETLDDYGDMWDQYILKERIFADTTLADSFNEINKAYSNYQDAFVSGDKQAIEETLAVYASAVNTALDNAGTDESVKEYFNNMYPALQSAVSEWNFKVSFDANTDDMQDRVQSALESLKDENGRQLTTEEILGLDKENEQYQELKAIADSYNMTLEEMIALLKERNLVADMGYQGLVSLFGQENIDKIVPEDLEIAYTIKNIGNMTFDELVAEIQRVKDEANHKDPVTLSVSSTIDQLNTQLKPAFDSLKSAYQDIFTDDGFALNEINIISTCDSIKSKLDEIAKINPDFDYSAYEDFVRVLSDSKSTTKDVKDAFNLLATSITQAALTGTEDFQTLKAALEDLGVVNNELVAFDALINNTEALKEAGLDLAEATDKDIEAFAEEIISAENLEQAINLLKIQKILCAENPLSTSTDIENLYNLAQAAGIATDAISRLMSLNSAYEKAMAEGNTTAAVAYQGAMAFVKAQVMDQFAHLGDDVDFSGLDKAAKKAGGSAGEKFSDALDKELNALDKKMEAGYIDFNDYIQARLNLIEDYYRKGKISADQYYSYLEKHYDKQLSYMDKVVNAVTRRIDKEIKGLQKNRDDIEDYYNLQIESLEKEKKLLEESNRERERQRDLQLALYNLERARNQRTTLQYSESKGMHYVASDTNIRNSEDEVADAQYQIRISEIEKSISKLEEARDRETKSIDEMIDKLQDYKDAWQDITSAYAEEQENLIAEQILGAEWETDILNCRLGTLDAFKNEYISIQQAMADAAWESANEQIRAAQEAAKGASGTPSSASTISTGNNASSLSDAMSTVASIGSSVFKNNKYASGTNNAKKGLNLVGEDGTEAYFDNDGHVTIVTEPTLIPMEGGEVVKNAQDTKKLLSSDNLKPVDNIGLADIDGKEAEYTIKVNIETDGEIPDVKSTTLKDGVKLFEDGTIIRPDGTVLTPIQPGDPMLELQRKFDAYIAKNGGDISSLLTPISFIQKDMERMVNSLNTVNNVSNSRMQQINIGDINITCPGVTSQEVAKQVGVELNKQFNGFSLVALQESKKR